MLGRALATLMFDIIDYSGVCYGVDVFAEFAHFIVSAQFDVDDCAVGIAGLF